MISVDQLPGKVKDLQAARTGDKTVYIRADARARFASVTDVIDELRTDGVDQLGLITEEIQDKNRKGLTL
jgi:biopolymer transport protein ExbD/biopolymer transport protein TolR